MKVAVEWSSRHLGQLFQQAESIDAEYGRADHAKRGCSGNGGETCERHEQTESRAAPEKKRLRGIGHGHREGSRKQKRKAAKDPAGSSAHDSILPSVFGPRACR